ncbi:ABC transporter substrate-binding protein [Cohnella mopanensis]|uniref:ABC transporter substrate-binding protein n=1 Tax=Cohnella mopanensis TaxID=2911966 RepID=UPI001EF8E617|nr:ABC transporter substrate-binding protein [Cohnella mopanensis]
MSKWKKAASLALVASMIWVSACSKSDKNDSTATGSAAPSSSAAASTDSGETYEVVMGYPLLGPVPKDLGEVEAAISKITKEKINVTVKLLGIPFGQWFQQQNLMLTGNEKLDVMLADFNTYGGMVAAKQLAPLDDLLNEQGQGIKDVLGSKLDVARIDGKIYATPVNPLPLGGTAIVMAKDILDQADIDISTINSTNDLDQVFKSVKEKNPAIIPIAANPQGSMPLTTLFDTLGKFDSLLDGLGVLDSSDSSMKVVNLYETPEYTDALRKLRSWYQAGYISKDAATTKVTGSDQIKAGKALATVAGDQPGVEKQAAAGTGKEMVKVTAQKPLQTTQGVLGLIWAIPANNSKNQSKAMEFLNLTYTDKDIINLINFGIEGKHYTKKSDNIISVLPGDGYSMHQSFMFGNVQLTYLTDLEDPTIREQGKAFEETFVDSKALGFTPNLDAVKTEVAAVKNVTAQFVPALETGSVDPDKILPQFIEKLKASGIDKIVAEKQKQLDAWLAASNSK